MRAQEHAVAGRFASTPDETQNLAADPKHTKTLQHLKDRLKAFQLHTRDPWQIMWSHETEVQGTGVNL